MPLITDAIGRVLGGRYRLVSPIGIGASAQVFLAEDVSLRRHVAVKILQPALATDQGFLRRFRAEARSAAALNHPHIARVFDWGEDEGGPYLVLEYLGGGSLLNLLERSERLSVAQATSVAAQAARGLAHAHARGLVHRDVKPANLLFDDEGRVRVADFGVARALAEGAWTEPAGSTVGTARYASPEQAQGLPLDGRSDVYSLSLVTFESLTGYVPFVLDTAIGTLTARIGATLPGHGAVGALQPLLTEGASPEVETRPDAATFAGRLEALAATLPRPQALPLSSPGPLSLGPPTAVAGVFATSGPPTVTADQTGVMASTAFVPGPDQVFDVDALERAAKPGSGGRPPRHRPWWQWALVAGVVVALIAGGLLAALSNGVFTPAHPVPAITGLTPAAARQALAKDHFTLTTGGSVTSISMAQGRIVSQDPTAGSSLKQGSAVHAVLSKGLPIETVPSLNGLNCNGATRLLEVNHLKGTCPAATAGYSNSVPVGQVINWSYANVLDTTRAPYGATVLIALSKGPEPKQVPDLSGETYSQAAAQLQALGLNATESTSPSTGQPAGMVDHTDPPAGTQVPPGTTVTVFVSTGPPTTQVPNLSGLSVSAALAKLQAANLQLGQVYGPKNGTVFASVPQPGQTVTDGSSVNVYTA